jgi:glutamate/tyrosine decarboxylase-like PLP-dependent enzyme
MITSHISRSLHFAQLMQNFLANQPANERLNLEGEGTNSLAAWFLGPRGENGKVFSDLIKQAIDANIEDRQNLYKDDPPYITDARKDTDYKNALATMKVEYLKLLNQLKQSVPFFSYRYQAHMNWDLTMPALLGYFAAMLYNQNNVVLEASPVTSVLEQAVGNDLCKMLGFNIKATDIKPWGHITCDGSVANLEAMWAARNLKYYPLSIQAALKNDKGLLPAQGIRLYAGGKDTLIEQDAWTLLNLPVDNILALTNRINSEYGIDPAVISNALEPYLLQTAGIKAFLSQYAPGIKDPVLMGPATKHYSWPKNAALVGIGRNNFINIAVDDYARMDYRSLDDILADCLKIKTPVLMVVAVLGSTEESAVDPLVKILEIRERYRKEGLDFAIHVDGAWGGYFASILRTPEADAESLKYQPQRTPVLEMSQYVTAQYRAIPRVDSVTIDPHKAGYVPYAAGGLCYRNKAMRNLIAFLAPEVYHGDEIDSNMGIFGVEGSKSGAAAASVYLSHRIIRPDNTGYGKILGQALFNSKRFFSAIITMANEKDDFIVVPVQQIPAEREGKTPDEIKKQLEYIRNKIVNRSNEEIIADPEAMSMLKELGSDQIIITYGLNFKIGGKLNTDIAKTNDFIHAVFCELSMQPGMEKQPELIITTSEFGPNEYGPNFVAKYMTRLGLDPGPDNKYVTTMNFLSSTTMCPWLTATETGNFIPTLINAFHNAVNKVLQSASNK